MNESGDAALEEEAEGLAFTLMLLPYVRKTPEPNPKLQNAVAVMLSKPGHEFLSSFRNSRSIFDLIVNYIRERVEFFVFVLLEHATTSIFNFQFQRSAVRVQVR